MVVCDFLGNEKSIMIGLKRHGKLQKNQIENAHEKWQNICSICSHSGIHVPRTEWGKATPEP